MAETMGGTIGDLAAGPDLGAVGNAARVSKKTAAGPQELQAFSVKKGDNGGVLVCETYAKKAPEGRRPASFLMGGGDYKENPFSPDDGAAAVSHITDLLTQMGIQGAAPEPAPAPVRAPLRPPVPPPRPPLAAAIARGPNAAGAAVRRPGAGGAMFRGPDAGY
jgi:hypothetical protein